MIISVLILTFVVATLVQFSFAYCRTLLVTYGKVELSSKVQELIAANNERIDPLAFHRLMVMVWVAPDPGDDAMEIRTIGFYYRLVRVACWLSAAFSPGLCETFQAELSRCSYFAAVSLDRRLLATQE
jgi:hypothetical protein